jgi:NAD-dependent DNA ligase
MVTAAIRERARVLRELLRGASDEYYGRGESALSDLEYDRRMEELRHLERCHPELVDDQSPTQTIGAPLPPDGPRKLYPHWSPMLSLTSVSTPEEARAFFNSTRKSLEMEPEPAAVHVPDGMRSGKAVRVQCQRCHRISYTVTKDLDGLLAGEVFMEPTLVCADGQPCVSTVLQSRMVRTAADIRAFVVERP